MTAKTILFTNQKGGVGKTTSTLTVAVGLIHRMPDERVLIIDTDPQGNAATGLNVEDRVGDRCLSRLLSEESTFSEQVVNCDRAGAGGPSRPNLYLIPASERLPVVLTQMSEGIGAMRQLADRLTAGQRAQMGADNIPTIADTFERILSPLKRHFAYILIDSQPSLGQLQEALHRFADFAVVPTEVDYYSLEQTNKHTQTILSAHTQARTDGLSRVRLLTVVPTCVDPRLSLTQELWQVLTQTYGRLLSRPVPRRADVAKGPALGGLTIFDYKPESDAAAAYQYLLDRVMAA